MKRFIIAVAATAAVFTLTACAAKTDNNNIVKTLESVVETASDSIPAMEYDSPFPTIAPDEGLKYPENFFTINGEPIDFNALPKPIELFYYDSANGPERLLDYGTVMALTLQYGEEEYYFDIGYKDESFATSENISTGSTKAEVLTAYQKYGIVDVLEGYNRNTGNDHSDLELFLKNGVSDYSMKELNAYSWLKLVKALAESEGNINTSDLLYVDNGTPEGVAQFGGLGALIFVFNDFDEVQMIISTAPTSG